MYVINHMEVGWGGVMDSVRNHETTPKQEHGKHNKAKSMWTTQSLNTRKQQQIYLVTPEGFDSNLRRLISELLLWIKLMSVPCKIVLRTLLITNHLDNWCRQTTNHYVSQCWCRSMAPYVVPMAPYVVTRTQWVKTYISVFIRGCFMAGSRTIPTRTFPTRTLPTRTIPARTIPS